MVTARARNDVAVRLPPESRARFQSVGSFVRSSKVPFYTVPPYTDESPGAHTAVIQPFVAVAAVYSVQRIYRNNRIRQFIIISIGGQIFENISTRNISFKMQDRLTTTCLLQEAPSNEVMTKLSLLLLL